MAKKKASPRKSATKSEKREIRAGSAKVMFVVIEETKSRIFFDKIDFLGKYLTLTVPRDVALAVAARTNQGDYGFQYSGDGTSSPTEIVAKLDGSITFYPEPL